MENHAELLTILILDDDPTVQLFLSESLTGDYRIVSTMNRRDFERLLPETKPHIILLDIYLPDGDGRDICSRLRESGDWPDLFIVIITSSDDRKTTEASYRCGADDLIRKPLGSREILSKMAIFAKIIRTRQRLQAINKSLESMNKAYRDEVSRIRNIQVAHLPRFDGVGNYDIATTYLPAQELSGDFMDGFFIDDETYQIVLCDVSGHGMASSYVGTAVRTLFRTASYPGLALPEMMALVNNTLSADLKGLYYFATVIVCRINIRSGALEYLNAGHPPALLNRAGTRRCVAIGSTGPLVGLFPDNPYRVRRLTMEAGDTLLLYTDGVTEARRDHDRKSDTDDFMFGLKRLAASYLENREYHPRDIIHFIVGSVYEFTDYHDQEDDITTICIRKK